MTLAELAYDDSFVRALPGDPLAAAPPAEDPDAARRPRQVPGASYSLAVPTPVATPRLLAWSDELAAELGLERPREGDPAIAVLAGNGVLPGMRPYAARYGGHQFGNWAGQLGDGRAITLGEVLRADGTRVELQLKGAGRTPYSRFADGRAVLRSSLREFLCSEAMHALGVPTTRALSLVATGEPVVRDMFYDGNARPEPGAIVCRVAPTFVRFGNFEIHAALSEPAPLAALAGWVIGKHYPELGAPSPAVYAAWFAEVCRRTAVTIAHWMRVGFVHGVMNTDNMSILGLTIDYGPYGWLEGYDPAWTPNTTDAQGRRYCYGAQPQIGMWNLARLAGALTSLIPDTDALHACLEQYASTFERSYREAYAAKLGFAAFDSARDETLLGELFELLGASETDLTICFRRLADVPEGSGASDDALVAPLAPAYYADGAPDAALRAGLAAWLRRRDERLRGEGRPREIVRATMHAVNPKYVPRNYLAQLAIDAAEQGDTRVLERLLAVLRRPYDEQPEHEELAARRPEWARNRAGCSALSCSS